MAFGISLTVSRLGTLFSFNTEAMIANYFGNYKYALWAALLLCLVSLASNLVANLMDARGERILKIKTNEGRRQDRPGRHQGLQRRPTGT